MGVAAARPHPKMWEWLHLEPPLLKLLEITTVVNALHAKLKNYENYMHAVWSNITTSVLT